MEITQFGYIWILLCLFFLTKPIKYLLGLVIFSCIFQAAAPILLGGQGISPLMFTELFLLLKFCLIKIPGNERMKINTPVGSFISFFVFATIITLSMPFIFQGMKVTGGTDDTILIGGIPLMFSKSNFFQIIIVFLNLVTFYIFYKSSSIASLAYFIRIFIFSICFCVFVGVWQEMTFFSSIPFPKDFFYSNSSHALLTDTETDTGGLRLTATFTEASAAGHFLGAAFWALQAFRNKLIRIISFVVFIAIVLTVSGTGYVILILGFGILLLLNKPSKLISSIVIGALFFLVLYVSGYFDIIWNTLQSKSTSDSGYIRKTADLLTWQVIIDSHLLGVGMGSNRGNSFLLNQIAAVGIIGVILLFRFLYYSLKPFLHLNRENSLAKFLVLYSLIFLVGQFVSGPDLSNPSFWIWIFVAASGIKKIKISPKEFKLMKAS